MASTVPTLKANLVAQLTARPGLSGVQVTNGPPLPAPSREFIWVGNTDGEQEFATFGPANQRREDYGVEVTISVLLEGTGSVAAETRCFQLAAELEQQLRDDKTVNGAVELAQYGGFRLRQFVSADGMNRESQLTITVNCTAWL